MASSKQARVDWSGLPSDMLDLICRRITTNADYVRFRAVCTSWRSATPARPRHLPCQLPWLALPSSDSASDVRGFFTLPNGKIHSMQTPSSRGSHCCGSSFGWLVFLHTSINLLFHYKDRVQDDSIPSLVAGSLRMSGSHDLLGMTPYTSRGSSMQELDRAADLNAPISFFLLNPITRERIPLPPLHTREVLENLASEPGGGYVVRGRPGPDFSCDLEYISRHFVHRFVLSSDPTSADCVAMASFCHGATLAFCRLGGGSWTTLSRSLSTPVPAIRDIVFYKGSFYAVDGRLVLFVCDVGPLARIEEFPYYSREEEHSGSRMQGCLVQKRRRRGQIIERVYLVESGGDLLMVLKTYNNIFAVPSDGGAEEQKDHPTLDFEVYKVDLFGERPRLVELESLGGRVLFLGPGQSISLSAGDWPAGCRGNCIYFSDYRPERHAAAARGGPDFGVFHYGDGHVERVPCCHVDAGAIWQPSIWISPSLRGRRRWA